MLLESKAFQQLFHTNLLKISFFNDGGLKLGHFDVFDILFPFLTFVKL